MPEYSDIEELIIRSLVGSISEDKWRKLDVWRKISPQNEQSFKLLKKTWEEKSQESIHQDYESMERKIIEAGFKNLPAKSGVSKARLLSIAAAVIGIICVTTWVTLELNPRNEKLQLAQEMVVTYNPTGQKSKISLPDNSIIWLNSESTLSYQKGFTDSIRYVELEGEAYFEVKPDSSRPFVVETGSITTKVLGTSFNIRNYPDENCIRVALLSGKVRIKDDQAANELFLEPFEQIEISKKTRYLKMTQLTEDVVSIWKDGIIQFKRSSFDHVIKTLERSYDVAIDTSKYSYGQWSYSGSFDNMSLEIVLTRLGYSEGFDFEIDGRIIKIMNEPVL